MLSELPFGAFLVYPPKGVEDPGADSARNFILRSLKQDRRRRSDGLTASQVVAKGLATHLPVSDSLIRFIGTDAVLVPVPRRARQIQGGLWPSFRIAEAMAAAGFGVSCVPILERIHAVPKSAFASSAEERPSPKAHFDSLAAHKLLPEAPGRLLLVDDVVTRGATLLGCASKQLEIYPGANIRGFAVARTLRSFPGLVQPVVGRVEGGDDWARREP